MKSEALSGKVYFQWTVRVSGAEDGTWCEQIILSNSSGFPRNVYQTILVSGKHLYTATGWMKTDTISTNSIFLIVWYNSINPTFTWPLSGYIRIDTVGKHNGSIAWTKDSATYVSPNNALSVYLYIGVVSTLTASGAAWFDNFNFYKSDPTGVIKSKNSPTFCQGNGDTLAVDTVHGYTYKWLKNNMPITGATSPFYYATQTGNYRVLATFMTITDTSNTIAVTANSLPLRNISTPNPTTFCQGYSALLTADSLYGYTYKWLKNGIIMPGKLRRTLAATDSGGYSAVVTNQFCTDTTNIINIKVNPIPVNILTTADTTTFCQGRNALLNADSFSGYTFKWLKGISIIAGKTTKLLDVTTPGTFSAIVSNSLCTDTTNAITITVNQVPFKKYFYHRPDDFLPG